MATPGRTVDTAWLRAAIGAINQEFEEGRLKLDHDFGEFAAELAALHRSTEEFIRPRAHLLDDGEED